MLYLQQFIFPNERQEAKFLYPKDKTPGEVSSGAFKDFARGHIMGPYIHLESWIETGLVV